MNGKVFVTDVDGVLLSLDPLMTEWIAQKYGKPGLPRTHNWELEHGYGIPKEELAPMWDWLWEQPAPAYPEAVEFVSTLKKRGWKVVALSNRRGRAAEASLRDLKEAGLFPLFDDLIYKETKSTKGVTVKALMGDIFLDDNFHNVYDVLHHSPATRCFLFDQPYNQSLDLAPPYTRVITYSDLLRVVR